MKTCWGMKGVSAVLLQQPICHFCEKQALLSLTGDKGQIYFCREHSWAVYQTLLDAVNEMPRSKDV